jgi:hypothetical protein
MKYPFHTVSKPVSGSEAEKLAQAIQSGGHLANEVALALMKKIADRAASRHENRRRQKSEDATK